MTRRDDRVLSLIGKPKRRRNPRHKGAQVNATIKLPQPPGPFVDYEQNYLTGDRYVDWTAPDGCDFDCGSAMVRAANGGFSGGGGFRSRGPILWAMRVAKTQQWFDKALGDAFERGWDDRVSMFQEDARYPKAIAAYLEDARAAAARRGDHAEVADIVDEMNKMGLLDDEEIPF